MSQEKIRILKMIEDGKLSVDEATEILKSLDESPLELKKKANKIKLLIKEKGKQKVEIGVPISLAKTVIKYIPRKVIKELEEQDFDIKEIVDALENDLEQTTLVNVTEDDVEIILSVE